MRQRRDDFAAAPANWPYVDSQGENGAPASTAGYCTIGRYDDSVVAARVRDPTALDPAVSDPPLDDHVGSKQPFNSLSSLQDAPP